MKYIDFDSLVELSEKYPNNRIIQNTVKIAKAIVKGFFNHTNYFCPKKTWWGLDIYTERLVCSYGEIGYSVWSPNNAILPFTYDWELRRFNIKME